MAIDADGTLPEGGWDTLAAAGMMPGNSKAATRDLATACKFAERLAAVVARIAA